MSEKKRRIVILQYLFLIVYAAALAAGVFLLKVDTAAEKTSKTELDLKTVLPSFSNHPEEESFEIEGRRIFPARHEQDVRLDEVSEPVRVNKLTGFAFWISENSDGEGVNPVLIGIDLEGRVTGLKPSFIRKALVPENRLAPDLVSGAQEFFDSRRALFIEKASEGTFA